MPQRQPPYRLLEHRVPPVRRHRHRTMEHPARREHQEHRVLRAHPRRIMELLHLAQQELPETQAARPPRHRRLNLA